VVQLNKGISAEVKAAAQHYSLELLNVFFKPCSNLSTVDYSVTEILRHRIENLEIDNVGLRNIKPIILQVKVRIAMLRRDIPEETVTGMLHGNRTWLIDDLTRASCSCAPRSDGSSG
jgi:hypothetical protein